MHSTSAELVYRHQWQPHDLVFWDNRSVWHYAVNDYHGDARHMDRITIDGMAWAT